MSITIGDALLLLDADDSALSGALGKAQGKVQGWLGSVGGLVATGLGGALAVAGGAVAGLGIAAFGAGNRLDAAFDTILVGTGATGAELAGLEDSFRNVFSSIPTNAGEAGQVIADLNTRLGLTGQGLENLATPLLEASRLLGGDAAQNTALFSRVLGDWSIEAENGVGVLDQFFVASQRSGAGMDQLMQKVVQFGAPMRLMGFTLEDSMALFGKWEKEGVNAELVMGSLRIAAGKFADEGVPLRESLLNTFDAIQNNENATEALALAMDVFGARAGPDMAAAIREGRFDIEDFVAALGDADGAILRTAGQTADWGEKWTVFKNKATLALEPFGMMLLDVASIGLDKLTPMLDAALPMLTRLGEGVAAGFGRLLEGDLGGAFDVAGEFFEDVIPGSAAVLQTVGTTLESIWNAAQLLITGDFTGGIFGLMEDHPAIAALLALRAGALDLWRVVQDLAAGDFDFASLIPPDVAAGLDDLIAALQGSGPEIEAAVGQVAGSIDAAAAQIGEAWAAVTAVVGPELSANIDSALSSMAALWEEHGSTVIGVVTFISTQLNATLGAGLALLGGLVGGALALMSGSFSATMSIIRGDWDGAWAAIKSSAIAALEAILASMGTSIAEMKAVFMNGVSELKAAGAALMDGLKEGIAGKLGELLGFIQATGEAIIKKFKEVTGISSPSKVFAGLGVDVMAGLAQGMTGAMHAPELALESLVPKLSAAALGGGLQAPGIGTQLNFAQHNTVRDDLDIEQIAYRVVDLINQRRS